MTLLWPSALLALLAIPAAIALSIARSRQAARREDLAALRAGDRPGRRARRIVFGLYLLATAVMIAALSRPEMEFGTPRFEGTIILAIDTSASMLADDVDPTRLGQAQQAARDFVDSQPDSIMVGLVTFSNNGAVVEPPGADRDRIIAAIDRLEPGGPTSLAQGLFAALDEIVEEPLIPADADTDTPIDTSALGFHGSSIVLVLSDGEDTSDTGVTTMAEVASALGVEVFTVGFGTPTGAVVEVEGFQLATALNEASLIEVADTTGGEYRHAATDIDISDLYDRVDRQFTTEGERTEVTAVVALAGALLLIIAALTSMRLFGRVP
ncbi:MAG: hypothetical protein DHS20C19_21890 [Acidimicrobiales bacterium]|nr:MAG: hypothetical protein DHS20C19_21890 [Acidimicrobiales bacterium]